MKKQSDHPICRHCGYDLITQLNQQAPGWQLCQGPVELMCPECGKTSTWPWVSPPPAPNKIPLIPMLLSVLGLVVFGVIMFALFELSWL